MKLVVWNKNKSKIFFLISLVLSIVFIYASLEKIYNPQGFAVTIYNYRLFPEFIIGPTAIFLPWLELVTGFLILFKRWNQAAALILSVLLVIFILAVGYNVYRGLDFECGCFGSSSGRKGGITLLIQDSFLLLGGILLIFRKKL